MQRLMIHSVVTRDQMAQAKALEEQIREKKVRSLDRQGQRIRGGVSGFAWRRCVPPLYPLPLDASPVYAFNRSGLGMSLSRCIRTCVYVCVIGSSGGGATAHRGGGRTAPNENREGHEGGRGGAAEGEGSAQGEDRGGGGVLPRRLLSIVCNDGPAPYPRTLFVKWGFSFNNLSIRRRRNSFVP